MQVVGSKCYCDPKCHTLVADSGQTQGVGGLLLEPTWEHDRGLKLKFAFQLLIKATKYEKVLVSGP